MCKYAKDHMSMSETQQRESDRHKTSGKIAKANNLDAWHKTSLVCIGYLAKYHLYSSRRLECFTTTLLWQWIVGIKLCWAPPALHWSAAPLCLWHEGVAHMAFPLVYPDFIESKPMEQNKAEKTWKYTVFQFVQKAPKQIKSAQAKPIKPPAEDRCNGLALTNSFTSDSLGDTLERHPNSQTGSNKGRLLTGSIHFNTILENEQSKLWEEQVLEEQRTKRFESRRWMRCSSKWKKWARPSVACNSYQVLGALHDANCAQWQAIFVVITFLNVW